MWPYFPLLLYSYSILHYSIIRMPPNQGHFQDRFTLFLIIVIIILFQVMVMNGGNYFITFFSDNITTISECKCKIKALVHLPESVYHNLDKFSVHWWLKIFSHIFVWRYILPPYMQDNYANMGKNHVLGQHNHFACQHN